MTQLPLIMRMRTSQVVLLMNSLMRTRRLQKLMSESSHEKVTHMLCDNTENREETWNLAHRDSLIQISDPNDVFNAGSRDLKTETVVRDFFHTLAHGKSNFHALFTVFTRIGKLVN